MRWRRRGRTLTTTKRGGVVHNSVMVSKKTHTISDLKDMCKALNLNIGGNKAVLFTQIWDCGSLLIVQIDDELFVFKKIRGEEADLFCHGDAPPLPKQFKEKIPNLSPMAMHVVWLALCLLNMWSRIYMDNLFNSWKLFTTLYMAKALAHGIVRTTGCGLPTLVRQLKEKNVKEAQKLRGRTAAARLVNLSDGPDLFACLVYDTKPVHMLSTVEESMCWVVKKRKVWSAVHREIREIGFLHLNFIDNSNNNMNLTDILYQLRGQYRPDHWMRNWKWWWVFFSFGGSEWPPSMRSRCMIQCTRRRRQNVKSNGVHQG